MGPVNGDRRAEVLELLGREDDPGLSLYRAFFDGHAAAMILLDPETGAVMDANPAACALYGFSREEMRRGSIWDVTVAPLETVRRNVLSLMNPPGGRITAVHRLASGGRIHVEIAAGPVDIRGFRLLHCVLYDVSGRARAEAEAEHQGGLRRIMLDSVRDAIALKGPDAGYLAVNQAFCELLGRDEDEILGRTDFDLFPRTQAERNALDEDRVRVTGRAVARDEQFLAARGRIWTNIVKAPVRDGQGQVTGVILAVRDISRRKQAEESLRKSEEEFRAIADYGHDWESWISPEGRLLWVNPAVERHTGYSVLECLAMTDYPLPLVDPEDREGLAADLGRSRELRESVGDRVFRVRRRDGTVRWMAASWQPIADVAGRNSGLRLSVRDITERRQAELLREDIERIVRHDLKGPLTSLLLAPDVLRQEGPVTPQQELVLIEMARASRRMLTMINRSLDLYKMETGVYRLEPVDLDLARLCRQELESARLAVRPGSRWRLLIDGRAAAPDEVFMARGEEGLLRTLLDNLAQNAFEALPEDGEVVLELARAGETVELALTNAGEIPREIRERLFQKYVTAGKRHGTGLGTYSARLVAQAHGGDIAVRTERPGFTTLRVRLGPLPGDA